jgi:hypothetical protein
MPWVSESMSKNGDSKIDYNEIENGLHLATSAHYFIKSYLGLGVQYSFFNPSMNEHENIEIEPTYPIFTSMQNNEKHYVHYVGLSAQFDNLFFKHDKIYFTQSISTGLIRYRAESVSEVLIPSSSGYPSIKINSLVQSYSWGATIGASAGYRIWPNLSLGAGINFLYADIKKVDVESYSSQQSEYKMDGMKLDNPISLSRFNFSVVLRYSI